MTDLDRRIKDLEDETRMTLMEEMPEKKELLSALKRIRETESKPDRLAQYVKDTPGGA